LVDRADWEWRHRLGAAPAVKEIGSHTEREWQRSPLGVECPESR
jgi:hypothetical protein